MHQVAAAAAGAAGERTGGAARWRRDFAQQGNQQGPAAVSTAAGVGGLHERHALLLVRTWPAWHRWAGRTGWLTMANGHRPGVEQTRYNGATGGVGVREQAAGFRDWLAGAAHA